MPGFLDRMRDLSQGVESFEVTIGGFTITKTNGSGENENFQLTEPEPEDPKKSGFARYGDFTDPVFLGLLGVIFFTFLWRVRGSKKSTTSAEPFNMSY